MNIELTSITRSFGPSKAVDRVSLQAGAGVLGLLGPNGAGKTSLLRMLATVLPPSSGEIRLLGRDPGSTAQRREIRRRLGYLPQNLGYYPAFTVVEYIEYFALLKEVPLLLLDEPTAGLDPEQRVGFRALLRDLGQAASVVVSTHLVEDVGAACSQVALMDAGRIVFGGTPEALAGRGTSDDVGDSQLERGYSAVLQASRSASLTNGGVAA